MVDKESTWILRIAVIIAGILLFLMIVLPVDCFALNYPSIAYEDGVNIQEAKDLIYSIPVEYYAHVDEIHFHTEYQWHGDILCNGWAWSLWNGNHDCFSTKIDIYQDLSQFVLLHELGHIHEQCVLKLDYEYTRSEKYADNYAAEMLQIQTKPKV